MEFDLVRRIGVLVVEVPGLDVDVAYVSRHHVAMVNADLTHIAREHAADWVLAEATRDPLATRTPGLTS